MDVSTTLMWLGFALSAYAVIGNDFIQTLGTFFSSNEKDISWSTMYAFSALVLSVLLMWGYFQGDVSFGRLSHLPEINHFTPVHILPPLVLLIITRYGIPVSTTFMILTFFSLSEVPADLFAITDNIFNPDTRLGKMTQKAIVGYFSAFLFSLLIYGLLLYKLEMKYNVQKISENSLKYWRPLQVMATLFLWIQWILQDAGNIYVFLHQGKGIVFQEFIISILIVNVMLLLLFADRGGKIMDVIRNKRNFSDIRSATFIDLFFGILLFLFIEDYFNIWGEKNLISTTWVFLGIMGGRELSLQYKTHRIIPKKTAIIVLTEFAKITAGLLISFLLVLLLKLVSFA